MSVTTEIAGCVCEASSVPINGCTGCGNRAAPTTEFRCTWPDARTSSERHCFRCQGQWHRQLRSLGATLVAATAADDPLHPLQRYRSDEKPGFNNMLTLALALPISTPRVSGAAHG